MPAYYSVIQYVPDPVIDERMNVGVLVYNEHRMLVRFVEDWKRVQAFGDRDVGFLRDFANDLGRVAAGRDASSLDGAKVQEMASRWMNSIQLTQPRGSILEIDDLFIDISTRFLRGAKITRRRARDRRAAVKLARDAITMAFRRRGVVRTEQHLSRELTLEGRIESHTFEIGISNGNLRAAIDALSFEGTDEEATNRDLRATAWSFGDVHTVNPNLQLSVVVLTKDQMSPIFQRAANIFDKLAAEMVTEDRVPGWADRLVETMVQEGGDPAR
jgi:hypothetical protein